MKKNDILTNVVVEKLIFWGKGMSTAEDGRKIMISGGVIPESTVNVRIIKAHKNYLEAQAMETVKKSPLESVLPQHFQVYGGCRWLPIAYETQLKIKAEQVFEAFNALKEYTENTKFLPIIASPEIYGYRNKVEFSWGKYISEKENVRDEYRFGFHLAGQFDRIEDCTFCVLASENVNAVFKKVDTFARESELPTYDAKKAEGFWRHLVVREAKRQNEIMLVFSVNHTYNGYNKAKEAEIRLFAEKLVWEFPQIQCVYLLKNSGRADIVQGEYHLLHGKPTITETLLNKEFEIHPNSFFQVNSACAEKLYETVLEQAGKWKTALDLYAGTGTIGCLLADNFTSVISVELVAEASKDGERNAKRNGIANVRFVNKKVEDFVEDYKNQPLKNEGIWMKIEYRNEAYELGTMNEERSVWVQRASFSEVDVVVIDPPRDGMYPTAPDNILALNPKKIIYVSCNPATLARDLQILLKSGNYTMASVTPVDMFPHTHHIETVAVLERKS